jgi:DNA-binding response OmpR family regulator
VNQSILIVDDDTESVEKLKSYLTEQKYQVSTASNSAECIETAEKVKPALVVVSLGLPDLGGLGVIKKLKENSALQNIPIIVSVDAGKVTDAIALADVTDFVEKPVDGNRLMSRIQWILNRKQNVVAPAAPEQIVDRTVLIVDDDQDLAETLKTRLKAAHMTAHIVNNGSDAVERVKREKPDLILMDLMMPKLDGYSTLKKINSICDPKIPVIIMTAQEAISEEEYSDEASAFIRKPIDGDELSKKIQVLLGTG